jgi:2'-5' RNA ligase
LEEEEIKNLINKLRKVKAVPKKIQFSRISVEPSKRKDMLWVVGESKGLEELRLEIYKAIGAEPTRKFAPHVSIAKLNKKFELSQEIDWFMPYDSFSVIKSELKPEGAEYSEIEKICL